MDEKPHLPSQPSPEAPTRSSPPPPPDDTPKPTGWRLALLLTALYTGLFLSFLDTTIVSVALPTIASTFSSYNRATWVLTAYLLTYMAFATIIARFSDIFGRKTVSVASFVFFLAFSMACALSRSMVQLIVFRALQGVGGSGLYSMTMIVALRMVEPKRMGMVGAGVGMVMVVSGVLGPVLSGAIAGNGRGETWRWIFWLNLPLGGLALAGLVVSWPRAKGGEKKAFEGKAVRSVDGLGCVLLLAASILLIFALEEGGSYVLAWGSATIIACLVISVLAFVAFVAWQICLAAHPPWPTQVVFPISVVRQRVVGAAVL